MFTGQSARNDENRSCTYLSPVLEPKPHILPTVDGDFIHHRVPEHRIKLGNKPGQLYQVGKELLYGFPTTGPVSNLFSDPIQPALDRIEPGTKGVISFLVLILVYRQTGVFPDALFHQPGYDLQLAL